MNKNLRCKGKEMWALASVAFVQHYIKNIGHLCLIENWLSIYEDNDPLETKETLDRWKKEGYDDFQSKQMIGQCLAVELFDVMKHGKPYNNKRYVKNLLALPKEPFF